MESGLRKVRVAAGPWYDLCTVEQRYPHAAWGSAPFLVVRTAKLSVASGHSMGVVRSLTRDVVTVGKAADNDIVLRDETVSHSHCELRRSPKGWHVRDLQSTNGTFVNGQQIRELTLGAHARLHVGAVELLFDQVDERCELLPAAESSLGPLIGVSHAMRTLYSFIQVVAERPELTVLLVGEPGTGKTLIGQCIHTQTRAAAHAPLLHIDCASLVGVLASSELLGHETGAFAGARQPKIGALEAAGTGTLVLGDVGELALPLQKELAGVLESRRLRRLGAKSNAPFIDVRARVIATTTRDLHQDVASGRFAPALLARLEEAPFYIPPLRQRREDIPGLLRHFETTVTPTGGAWSAMSGEVLRYVQAHDWPGNVDELRRFVALGHEADPVPFNPAFTYRAQKEHWLDVFERRYVTWLLAEAGGNVSKAARLADMDRKYLHRLIRKHALTPVDAEVRESDS